MGLGRKKDAKHITSIESIEIGKTRSNIHHISGQCWMRIHNDDDEKEKIVYLTSKDTDLIYTLNNLEHNLKTSVG